MFGSKFTSVGGVSVGQVVMEHRYLPHRHCACPQDSTAQGIGASLESLQALEGFKLRHELGE